MVARDRDLDSFVRLHGRGGVLRRFADLADGFGYRGLVKVLQVHGCDADHSYRVADVAERLLEVGLGGNGFDVFVRDPQAAGGELEVVEVEASVRLHVECHGRVLPRIGLIYVTGKSPVTAPERLCGQQQGVQGDSVPLSSAIGSSAVAVGCRRSHLSSQDGGCPFFEVCATHGCQRQCVPPDASSPRLDPTGISDSPSQSGSL